MTQPGLRLVLIGVIVAVPGILLVVLGSQGLLGFGIALLLIGSVPGALGLGLLFSGSVARWAARHRLFA